ncbi:non-homologous end-joining factor 1-like isoform X2 [Amphibalanus amphitrite]|nr:non-homologous end-joining factor 1-like isoform X2 [Amphibalanus amphitrite]XP_043214093.1 non-homologous end-joining factor 1-like isoform X2 [Amphibalanus amphitrite]
MAESNSTPWRAWEGLDEVLYQFSAGDGGYILLLTDLCQLWTETVDADTFVERLRELNPALEATGEQALPRLAAAVGAADSGAAWDGPTLRLDSRRDGVPLRWQFRLRPLPTAELAGRLLRPLLTALGQMQARERRLLAEVAARDRELQDYRESGARLTLATLRTRPLGEDRFETEMADQGLVPARLVDAGAWRAAPPASPLNASPVKVAPASPAPPPPAQPPKEDEQEAAERRRRELKQRLEDEARRSELERKSKKKKLNL